MRYEIPTHGPYEANLTPISYYDLVGKSIDRHLTPEFSMQLLQDKMGLNKLWMKEEVRAELEEFISSFLLSDLSSDMPDLETVLTNAHSESPESYQQLHGTSYSSATVQTASNKLKKRFEYLTHIQRAIVSMDSNKIVSDNAYDSIANLAIGPSGFAEMFLRKLI
ncbi:hypothetical protein CMO83_02335 [Candidatus Woesearchaeota archaeon]|jgi:hypothetical protein|nr:hypothetical protein [Candidatus Woesearchaeota archaeon]MDP6648304.1 hypothetical protein [Candidatus Woesearchaeota archaeon]|tara:strand:+ start:3690 stop:4184 length:495 start_codon:yes stop_codon:yes gene_type:complete